jgi:hypothetical protein
MARRTGKDGNILIGATIVPALREWSYREGTSSIDNTAAGDAWEGVSALRGNYEFNWRSLLEIPGSGPYVIPSQAARGTEVAWVGELVAADAQGLVRGTGLLEEINVTTPYDGMVELTGRIRGNGTAPIWDLEPAT